jgi:hypothetical protein
MLQLSSISIAEKNVAFNYVMNIQRDDVHEFDLFSQTTPYKAFTKMILSTCKVYEGSESRQVRAN